MRNFINLMEGFTDTNDVDDSENEFAIRVSRRYLSKVKTVLDHARAVKDSIVYQVSPDDDQYAITVMGPSTYVDVIARHIRDLTFKVNRPGRPPELSVAASVIEGLDEDA